MKRYAANGVHEKVAEFMSASAVRGDVLDVPTGQGALAEDMEALGFRVFPADLAGKNIVHRNGRCVCLDLGRPLPFYDESFDHIVCVEGIEHLENPYFAVGEFFRLLKRDGHLIITTPNVMSFNSRMRFLLCGHMDHFRYFGPLPASARHRAVEHEHGHVTPISYPQMRYMLEKSGFSVEGIGVSRIVKRWRVLYPLLRPVIRHKTMRHHPDAFYVSDSLMEGEVLVFLARK